MGLIDPRFYKSRKEKYSSNDNLIAALFIVTTLRDRKLKRPISRANETQIISRLRRDSNKFEEFRDQAPAIKWDNINLIEDLYKVKISICTQPHMKDLPKVIRSPGRETGTEMFLISRKPLSTSDSLRYTRVHINTCINLHLK